MTVAITASAAAAIGSALVQDSCDNGNTQSKGYPPADHRGTYSRKGAVMSPRSSPIEVLGVGCVVLELIISSDGRRKAQESKNECRSN